MQLGHYLGPVVLKDEYEDADVLKVLARLAVRRRAKEDDESR